MFSSCLIRVGLRGGWKCEVYVRKTSAAATPFRSTKSKANAALPRYGAELTGCQPYVYE